MNYPVVVFQVGHNLYAPCGLCNGSGKRTDYTSTSDEPGTRYGQETQFNCKGCKGLKYDKSNLVRIVAVKETK